MSTHTEEQISVKLRPLVTIRARDPIVQRVRDVDASLRLDTEVQGLQPEWVEQCKAGEVRSPSVRLNDNTIIDLFPAPNMEPIGRTAPRNQDHCCMVLEP